MDEFYHLDLGHRHQDSRHIREVLGLPEDVTITALIPVGYPKGPWGRPWRKPWQESTHWDRWGG